MRQNDPTAMNDPAAQWAALKSSIAPELRSGLESACRVASRVHAGQVRKSPAGSAVPYIVHPVRVARILFDEWRASDLQALQTAILHDVLEDCLPESRPAIEAEIASEFGQKVLGAVTTLTKPAHGPVEVKAARDARYFKELFAAPSWIRLVKCADRVDNLRDACNWGDVAFWGRYSSETIGWHLYLARETSPIAEVTLFRCLVDGERKLRGRVPVWADGHLIDPTAAAMVPEHISRAHGVIGLAIQGKTLIVGLGVARNSRAVKAVAMHLRSNSSAVTTVKGVRVSEESIHDAISAGLYGAIDS